MIEGRKPNGYLVTGNAIGQRVEQETRQCVHCQYMWIYSPRDEARVHNIRGFCLRCYGYTCERPECHAEQALMLQEFPGTPCISFYEHYMRRLSKIAKDPLWEVSPSGVIMPKDEGVCLPL